MPDDQFEYEWTIRSKQTVHDLSSLAVHHKLYEQYQFSVLKGYLAGIDLDLDADTRKNITSSMLANVNDPATQPLVKAACVAVLLIDGLLSTQQHRPHDFEMLFSFWKTHKSWIFDLPKITRATILNGFREVAELEFQIDKPKFEITASKEFFLSQSYADISTPLVEIAKQINERMLREMALADYGASAIKHYEELKKLIFEQDCIYGEDQHICPSSVVELESYVPHGPNFVVATAITILNHINDPRFEIVEFNWERDSNVYLGLKQPERTAILNGFRHCYESEVSWQAEWVTRVDEGVNISLGGKYAVLPAPTFEIQ
jgi:hypothetical protein